MFFSANIVDLHVPLANDTLYLFSIFVVISIELATLRIYVHFCIYLINYHNFVVLEITEKLYRGALAAGFCLC